MPIKADELGPKKRVITETKPSSNFFPGLLLFFASNALEKPSKYISPATFMLIVIRARAVLHRRRWLNMLDSLLPDKFDQSISAAQWLGRYGESGVFRADN